MKFWQTAAYAVWTVVGVVSLVVTLAYTWMFKDVFKSVKDI